MFFGIMVTSSPFLEWMTWRPDFHDEAALRHINAIFLDDVYIQANGYYQPEYLWFVARYFSGKITDLILACHILVEFALFARDHCGRSNRLETSRFCVWQDSEVFDAAMGGNSS